MTIGVERERFIVDPVTGKIVSRIGSLLPAVHHVAEQCNYHCSRFTYELFAGQLEDKTLPCQTLADVSRQLQQNDRLLLHAAEDLGLAFSHREFAEEHQIDALEANPFDRRHQAIWQGLPNQTRLAASAVAAVHVHVAVDQTAAVSILNVCREGIVEELIHLGDHSAGRRIASYRQMAGTCGTPPRFDSFEQILDHINHKGGEKNVWDLVRYKPSTGTIEFRMFGATPDIAEIIGYVQACLDIVNAAG